MPPWRIGLNELSKRIYDVARVRIGTSESELTQDSLRELFFFRKAPVATVMEAYALLYRLRWVRYASGSPVYELILGKDQQDALYAPQDPTIKKRYEQMSRFMADLERLPAPQRDALLGGKPIKINTLPEPMRDALQQATDALTTQSTQTPAPLRSRPRQPVEPQLAQDPESTIQIERRSPQGSAVDELYFGLSTNNFSSSFRWTNYDAKKHTVLSPRPVEAVFELAHEDTFSRREMIRHSALLTKTQVELPARTWTLKSSLQYLHGRYDLKLLAHEPEPRALRGYALPRQRLADFLDQLCQDFGGWEWELGSGNFLVFRAPNSPRIRVPV